MDLDTPIEEGTSNVNAKAALAKTSGVRNLLNPKKYSKNQAIIAGLLVATVGGFILIRVFAASALTKVWDTSADWNTGTLNSVVVNNGSVTLASASSQSSTTNLALNKSATASSTDNTSRPAANAFDGNTSTRWSSSYSDTQWISVDLGTTYNINEVKLNWETAYGKSFQIQVSNDGTTWANIYSTTSGTGGNQDLTGLSGSGRYVRMYGTVRGTQYGYSLWEMGVYGSSTASSTTNLALAKPAVASSTDNSARPAANAVDGDSSTRWSSTYSDPQWIYVDLGATSNISEVKLSWEVAYAKSFQIQVSNDATNWTNMYSTTAGTGGVNDLTGLTGSGRYVRMYGTVRGTQYGYSLYEMAVYGTSDLAASKPTSASSIQGTGYEASRATDSNASTRWASALSGGLGKDPEWITVDLGAVTSFNEVKLNWEAAYATSYAIQTSPDNATWTNVYSTTTGTGGINDLKGLAGSGRYVRMYGSKRGTPYGYSLYSMEIYGSGSSAPATNGNYVASGSITLNFDATAVVDWTSQTNLVTSPSGTTVSLQFRTSTDNANWSAWNTAITGLPNGRYLQVLGNLSTTVPTVTPSLDQLAVNYSTIDTNSGDTVAPTVSMSAPANGTTVSGTTTLSANASDNVGVTKVEFYEGTNLLGTDTSAPYSYAFDTTKVPNSSYALNAKAYDAAGNVATSPSITVTVSNTAPPTNYSFDDEFNGTSLDTSKWEPNWLGGVGPVNGAETACYEPAQVTVSGGYLNLTSKSGSSCGKSFATGNVDSAPHFTFTTGTLTIRAMLPGDSSGVYNWPALWTDGTGTWPNTGESDMMEGLSGRATCTYHSPQGSQGCNASGTSGWHIYSETVTPGKVVYSYDGVVVGTITNTTVGYHPHFIIMGNQMGSYGGKQVVPTTMQVDYVRVNKTS